MTTTGDDLRRRSDDPRPAVRDTHPVVFVGAGSHSGACLPGDYLVTRRAAVAGTALAALRRLGGCSCRGPGVCGTTFGLPFIDYHRGDGPAVGRVRPRVAPGAHR